MIVVTDGESHDSPDLQQAVEDSEKDNITLYAIAVSTCNYDITLYARGAQAVTPRQGRFSLDSKLV